MMMEIEATKMAVKDVKRVIYTKSQGGGEVVGVGQKSFSKAS